MNEPAAANEQEVVENEQGVDPNLSLNPHLGQANDEPDGHQEQTEELEKDDKVTDAPSDGEDNAAKEPDDDVLKRRVGELAYENRELKRALEGQQQPTQQDEVLSEPLKTLKDFGYDEQAFNGYLIEKGAELGEKRARAAAQKSGVESEAESRQREFEIREDAFEAEIPGFKERLHAPDLMITPEMAMFIADPASDVGLHVGDFLSLNKTEAAKIAGMSPTEQMRAMTQLETKIGKEVAKAKAAKQKASNAPEPPAGLDGTDPGVSSDPSNPVDADKMDDVEWSRLRNKQLEARRKSQ